MINVLIQIWFFVFWTDDEPDDGAHYYFIILGFPNLQLLPVLIDLGINISSVIQISSENYKPLQIYLEATKLQKQSSLSLEGNLVIKKKCKKEIILYAGNYCSGCVFLPLYALCLCLLPVNNCVCQCQSSIAIGWPPNQMVCQCKNWTVERGTD